MEEISARIRIDAPPEEVWKVVSDIDNDPQFWDSIIKIRNVSTDGGVVVRDVFIGGDNRCQQRVILFPREGIHVKWTKGPISGVRDTILYTSGTGTRLEIQMRYRLTGVLALFSKNAANYLREEVESALQMIKAKSEGTFRAPILEERRMWADLIHEKG